MPKTVIDYSNTIIYKITCKDPSINDVYVGHTTNFVQRKHAHKQSCINEKSSNYNCKLYKTIRVNGGWDNWLMEIVAFYKCYDHYEARMKEQEHFISLNATLNSIEPFPKPKEIPLQENITVSEEAQFICDKCNYSCHKKYNLDRHITSNKHLNMPNGDNAPQNDEDSVEILYKKKFTCECGKEYIYSQGLSKHKKQCKNILQLVKEGNPTDKEIIMLLIKENSELKNLVLDVLQKIQPVNNIS